MTDVVKMLDELSAATSEFQRKDAEREVARERVVTLALALLRAEVEPGAVYDRVPFTNTQMRNIAREAGIPPGRPGIKKRRRPAHDDES